MSLFRTAIPVIKWKPPPPPNVNKLNFDGSVRNNSQAAAGFVVRNSLGNHILAASKKLGFTNVLVAEALALREGLIHLRQSHDSASFY
ncbi:hypothetical protein ACLB2K_026911 [Fragaria x ananassa]